MVFIRNLRVLICITNAEHFIAFATILVHKGRNKHWEIKRKCIVSGFCGRTSERRFSIIYVLFLFRLLVLSQNVFIAY